jgi:hypothetical protein
MKTLWILLAAAVPALAQQSFDFKLLDKLGAKAKESTNITLDGDTLKMAANFLGDGQDSVKAVVKNIKGIYVRTWEFTSAGQYDPVDLTPLRAFLKSPQWNKIVDVKDTNETNEIYLQPLPNDQLGGLAVINAAPKEVNIVFITGVLNMSDVNKLSGNLGIPDMKLNHDGKKADSPKKD